jgi:hypothetical protein
VISAIFIAASCATAAYIVAHRDHAVVKGTSLHFSLVILFGICLGLCSVFVLFTEPTAGSCTGYMLMSALSYALILASLVVKTWRIWRIFEHPVASMQNRKALSNERLFMVVFFLLAAELGCLLGMASIYPYGLSFDLINGDEFGERRVTCGAGLLMFVIV